MMRFLCILLAASLLPASCLALSFSDRYDRTFQDAAGRWLPGHDWQLLKAQCYQESRLDPLAMSPVGAMGLCQFMPGTWKQVTGQISLPRHASAFAPDLSIEAAAYYMSGLRGQWSSPRPERDRHSLAMASYNAGLGHILNAQKRCRGALLYTEIIHCLPAITGHHSRETITYVDRIWRWWTLMKGGW